MNYIYVFVAGVFTGGTLSYLYAKSVLAKAKVAVTAAANSVAKVG